MGIVQILNRSYIKGKILVWQLTKKSSTVWHVRKKIGQGSVSYWCFRLKRAQTSRQGDWNGANYPLVFHLSKFSTYGWIIICETFLLSFCWYWMSCKERKVKRKITFRFHHKWESQLYFWFAFSSWPSIHDRWPSIIFIFWLLNHRIEIISCVDN